MYITIEGIDGSGKSSLIERLKERLPNASFYREPGSTDRGELLRTWSTSKNTESTNLLIYLLSRSLLMQEKDFNGLTIVDRGILSTLAYNSEYIDQETLFKANQLLGLKLPDLIIYLYTSPAIAVQRIIDRGDKDIPSVEILTQYDQRYFSAINLIQEHCSVIIIPNIGSLEETLTNVLLTIGVRA